MAYPAVIDWFEAERDEFIDSYLRDHPDASEFEAALMWSLDATPTIPKDYADDRDIRDNR